MKTIRLITNTPEFSNDMADVIRLMLAPCEVSETEGECTIRHTHVSEGEVFAEVCETENVSGANGPLSGLCTLSDDGILTCRVEYRMEQGGALTRKRLQKRAAKTSVFRLLGALAEQLPPWGSLTGIRPTRLLYEALEEGMTVEQGEERLREKFYVSPSKASLLGEIIGMQKGLIERPMEEFDLYIGIPFCRTRCSYCSFAAGELGKGTLVEPYIAALEKELAGVSGQIAEQGLRVRAAYIGGGTPTAITAEQLQRVIRAAKKHFPGAREWTVEAGRPDTIDRKKLEMLREEGIGRICVNPQTFQDKTLELVGRGHDSAQTVAAYQLARELGFDHINMDFIAALPGETFEDFTDSIRRAIALAPESITVHALAIKHSSRLNEQKYVQTSAETAQRMVETAREMLAAADYHPYYLYRQKYMAGNLENVGYAKKGCACLYNIDNMEETTPVLAFGAGSITKWMFPGRDDGGRDLRIERAPNVRNIQAYIDRTDEMIRRKLDLIG